MTAGRHRSPPPAKPPDYTIPLGIAAGVLTAASLVAIAATAVAPDASAAARDGVAVSTASRSARTVHVPVTILPAPVPTIGAEGAWDPEAAPTSMFAGATATASAPAGAPQTTPVGTRSAESTSQAVLGTLVTQESLSPTTSPTTTSPSPTTTAAATTTSSATTTEEEPVTPTADPTPTDIGDVIDEVLGTEGTP